MPGTAGWCCHLGLPMWAQHPLLCPHGALNVLKSHPPPIPMAVYVRACTHSSLQLHAGDLAAPGGQLLCCALPKSMWGGGGRGSTGTPFLCPQPVQKQENPGRGSAGAWVGGGPASPRPPKANHVPLAPCQVPPPPPLLCPLALEARREPGIRLDSREALGFGPGHAEEGGESQFPAFPCPLGPPGYLPTAVSPGPSFQG